MQKRERDKFVSTLTELSTSHHAKRQRPDSPPLRIQVLQSRLPEDVRMAVFNELSRMTTSSPSACDKYMTWVRRLLELPFGVYHSENDDVKKCDMGRRGKTKSGATVELSRSPPTRIEVVIARAKEVMDQHVTGHADVKVEILKLVCQSHMQDRERACASQYSLGLEGPPGVGKTHFVRVALAAALGRPLVCIPLGGANDVSYLLGHLYSYEGSKEGRLAAGLIEARCCNPIMYFDELDKVSNSERGTELISVLIHLVDPTSNTTLRDRYFHGIDIDFSKCTFVFSYNDASRISPILLDRIKRIRMSTPTDAERRLIICNHLIPRIQLRLNTTLSLSSLAIDVIVRRAIAHSKNWDHSAGSVHGRTTDGRSSGLMSECRGGVGMRCAEKDVDHVIASAQLCLACESKDGTIVGAPHESVLDLNGDITAQFTQCTLVRVPDSCESDLPPASMYM